MKKTLKHLSLYLEHLGVYIMVIVSGALVSNLFKDPVEWQVTVFFFIIVLGVALFIYFFNLEKKKEEKELDLEKEEKKHVEAKITELQQKNEHLLKALQEELENKKIYVRYEQNQPGQDNAYEISALAVSKAEKEIVIVADYSPYYNNLVPPVSRQKYYHAIENVIKEKVEKESWGKNGNGASAGFSYIRFMQRSPDVFGKIDKTKCGKEEGLVIEDLELIKGDEQAFAHCKRIFNILSHRRSHSKIKFKLYLTQFVPSIPSILIVDDRKLMFTIPERIKGPHITTAGVLDFLDNTVGGKALVQPFKEIVHGLTDEGGEYAGIESISDKLEDLSVEYKNHLYNNLVKNDELANIEVQS